MKKNNFKSKYEKISAVGSIVDPRTKGRYNQGRHYIYVDKKLGYVCVEHGTDRIITHNTNKRKCEDSAKNLLLLEFCKEKGKDDGKECLYIKTSDSKHHWARGKIVKTIISTYTSGLQIHYEIEDLETGVIINERWTTVILGDEKTLEKMRDLQKHYDRSKKDMDFYSEKIKVLKEKNKLS
jgi:hypothetical protein